MKEKFLPIGTICRLKGATNCLMIIGFCVAKQDEQNKIYDYIGCMYPQGMISQDISFLFDHSQIDDILYEGFVNEAEKEFKNQLNELIKSKFPEDNQKVNETTIQSNQNTQYQAFTEQKETTQLPINEPIVESQSSTQNINNNPVDLFSALPNQPNINNLINNNQ